MKVILGKDGTQWKKEPPKVAKTRPHNIVMKLPGVVGHDARNAKTVFEYWNLFFTDYILNLLVQHTNQHIEKVRENFQRGSNCRPTNMAEIKGFLGLLYLAGLFRGGHQRLSDFWTTDGLGINIFRMTMSEKRFRFLIRCLRFDDKNTRETRRKVDKLAAIREVFTVFIENCQKHYHIGQNATVDEMLPSFRGRCSFRQYIPSKPNKYGIKIFCLSDAKLYYTSNMEIYCGRQPEGPYFLPNTPDSIVMRLCTPIFGSGRNITADNWFTSLKLVRQLIEKKLSYVGTVRKNKRELPPMFASPRNRSCFSSIFGYTKDETLVSYVPKKGKTVLMLSSMHTSSKEVSDEPEKKPEVILFYNKTKSGVDVIDKLCATYNVARSTRRWPMVIFYHLMNIAGVNSRIIFLANKNKIATRRDYLKELAQSLVEDQLKIRAQSTSLPVEIKNMLEKYKPQEPEPETSITSKKRRCQPCYRQTKKSKSTIYSCEKCNTSLCLKQHTKILCESCFNSNDANEDDSEDY